MPGTWRSELKSLEFPGLMPSECVSRSDTTRQKMNLSTVFYGERH